MSTQTRDHDGEDEERFVRFYLDNGRDHVKAAELLGHSRTHAVVRGAQYLATPRVQELLKAHNEIQMSVLGVTPERVIREVATLAFANIADFMSVDANGARYIDIDKVPAEQMAAISSLTYEKAVRNGRARVRIKMHDKLDALEKLAKYLGLYAASDYAGNMQQLVADQRTINIINHHAPAPVHPDSARATYARIMEGSAEEAPPQGQG